jgi:hypothetical protein
MQVLERHLFEILHLPSRFKIFGGGWLVLASLLTTSFAQVRNVIFKFISSFQKISTHSELPSLHFLFEPFLILGAPHSHSLFTIQQLHCCTVALS